LKDLGWLNSLPVEEAKRAFLRCCGSKAWAAEMARRRPFAKAQDLFQAGEAAAGALQASDWREAFSHHPRIGDIEHLRDRYGATAEWSEGEQRGIVGADETVLARLAQGNQEYIRKHGFVFLVCATGKSASEMLVLLESRLPRSTEEELVTAAAEQRKITRLRLEKLLESEGKDVR
jgi:2-oxo-4-hydroxy-4-carboxy-5-ureidoimidazoline decarboxylase